MKTILRLLRRRVLCLIGRHEFTNASVINRVFEHGPTRTSVLLRCACGEVLYP